MNQERRKDFPDGHMIIETEDYFAILTPTSDAKLPRNIFWEIIAYYAHRVTGNTQDEGISKQL